MDHRPPSDYTQSEQASAAAAAAASTQYAPHTQAQSDVRPTPQYTPQPEVRSATISSSNTPQSDYGLNQPPAVRSPYPEYLARPPQYHHVPNSQAGGAAAGMAHPSSPSLFTSNGGPPNNNNNININNGSSTRNHSNVKSDADFPIDPSIAASSPTYPPPYSPYQPPAPHDLAQYQGHPHPPPQMYARPPEWAAHGYPPQHGLPTPYPAPATTVYSFVPIPGAQQHKRPRRRYEEIERMYKCGWNGCEKAYGTLNHLNAHVMMQSHGPKRTPDEFKEIRKQWKARKKEEEAQRKSAEERERAAAAQAAQAAQASQVETAPPTDLSQPPQPPSYPAGVRPQLPPIGYQPADGQVPGQYGAPGGPGIVYQSNGQMAYPPNYPHSPYAQNGQVYQQHPMSSFRV